MEIAQRRSRATRQFKNEKNPEFFGNSIKFYKIPPTDTISLQEFEEYAVERLKVLKAVDTAGIRHIKNSQQYTELLEKEIGKTKFAGFLRKDKRCSEDLQRLDIVSHFILRLAYCRSEELRRWFLMQELDLFRFRFQKESAESRSNFLVENNLNYKPITENEKLEIKSELIASAGRNTSTADVQEYFKVPFIEAFDLISRRKVYLKNGFAYVPRDDMISILLTHYRAHLSHSLAVTCRALPHLEEDDRLLPLVCGLSKRYVGQDYSTKKANVGQVTADMIDMLSKQSFPLCMQELHSALKQNHHLRHGGRQQYGLFLKGIGMTLEEALKFWRKEFCKILDGDKFDKQYAYNIRHNFGKEGKRTDYTPYSCMKIIMSNPPAQGDYHGCPFRHCDHTLLSQKLRAQGLTKDAIEKIMNDTKSGHYGIACNTYFLATHPMADEREINISHPNQYFEESQKLLQGNKGGKTPSTPKVQYTPQRGSQSITQHTPTSKLSQNSMQESQGTPGGHMSGIEEMDEDDEAIMSMDL